MSPDPAIATEITTLRAQIEESLVACLESPGALAPRLNDAMRYATLAGGKRLRALLCCSACLAFGGRVEQALIPACAVELIHSYSLIHDDLPAMDDDALRRGVPTCHIQFDEAEAILAGDALQALAFQLLAGTGASNALAMVDVLARAAGPSGMVGGQSLDIAATGDDSQPLTQEALEALHGAKSGALIAASIRLGALTASAQPSALEELSTVGLQLGLAFQVIDDVLDVSASTEQLGKDAGSDAAQGKTTFVDLLGVEPARRYAETLHESAQQSLDALGSDAEMLRQVARSLVYRSF